MHLKNLNLFKFFNKPKIKEQIKNFGIPEDHGSAWVVRFTPKDINQHKYIYVLRHANHNKDLFFYPTHYSLWNCSVLPVPPSVMAEYKLKDMWVNP